MNPSKNRLQRFLVCCAAPLVVAGCAPSAANIELRKKIQTLETASRDLTLRHDADAATIRSLESQRGTLPTLPNDRLETLFTTHALRINRLTRINGQTLEVYVVPLDQTGDELKAAGAITVELYELSAEPKVIGRWQYSPEQTSKNWLGQALLYEYVLHCPISSPLPASQATLKVTFEDALTGRQFTAQKVLDVHGR